ncbi:MAG TPA: ATP-binding protein, partial [Planctomycetota bacterium]|nr:ATP-binding protein [Planctomycetota bacterium]
KLPPVRCFHGQMNQVLLNLVKNAIEAMGGKGRLTISTAARGRKVLVTVADTGRGIPRRELGKIFEPFYTTKEGGRGMGLGLSISASILQNHGGRLRVSSRPGRGTTFTVELPKG